ncbi:MAG: cupin domain-containing protein [Steroidobacteraceae bacterium]
MRTRIALVALAFVLPSFVGAQSSVDLAGNRPATPGVTRTTLKDDAKYSVVRVAFAPGAGEVPHTHPYDIMIIPVKSGPAVIMVGDSKTTTVKAGEVQFVPHDVVHSVTNTGTVEFEVITVAIK